MFRTRQTIFYSWNIVNFFIVYKWNIWPGCLKTDFTLKDCLPATVKLTKNADPDTYSYSGYDIGFNSRSPFEYQSLI